MSWVKQARSLVAPALPQCLFCGRQARSSPDMPGICLSCYSRIPWIRRPRCQTCGRHVGCPDCSRSRGPVPIRCNRSAVAYTSEMREILGQYKYRGDERLAPLLGQMLDKAYALLQKEQSERQLTSGTLHTHFFCKPIMVLKSNLSRSNLWQADLLVPVPVSTVRLLERGFNQAEQLAAVLCRSRDLLQLPLLVRTHHTAKQSFKSRSERLADMKHAFTGNTDEGVLHRLREQLDATAFRGQQRPLRIIIIDDIYTTGSTIRACADALHRLCESMGCTAEIYSLTWARS
ncbi:ComF family protein [Paenibacillus tritici]|uniref:ComF family protein n=1 Tax=Paenibacillus tritici TaxID=1873425 RepID=UPI001BAE1081|nr:ComF family protein [Paenibacillus tritici]QUL54562.1 ComF family protein [Paenibacillus tritici]